MHWVRANTQRPFPLSLTAFVISAALADAQLCPGSNGQTYTDSCGAKYVIECDTDHAGGDLSGITAPYVESLEACIAICSANSACKDVSWILGSPKGACYQKGSVGATESNVGIWTGRQISGCQAVQVAQTTTTPAVAAPAAVQTAAVAAQPTTVIINNQPAVVTTIAGAVANGGGGDNAATTSGAAGGVANSVANGATTLNVVTRLSTLAGGSIVTLASTQSGIIGGTNASAIPGGSMATNATLRAATASTSTDAQGHTKTVSISASGSSSAAVGDTFNGLPTRAYIGLGVGVGAFLIALVAFLFWFQRHSKRKKARSRYSHPPSLDDTYSAQHETHPRVPEMEDSSPTQPQERLSPASGTLLSIGGSIRSPVSPWTSSPNVAENLAAGYKPVYYEMEASGPVEMPGSLVPVAEKVGSPVPDSLAVLAAQEEEKTSPRKGSTEKMPGMLYPENIAGKAKPAPV